MGKYSYLKVEYPDAISKEQFCKICHMAKETARYYLAMGIIPCTVRTNKTNRYSIKIDDVVEFLEKRDAGKIPTRPRKKLLRPDTKAIRHMSGSESYRKQLRKYFGEILGDPVYTPRSMADAVGLSKTVILRFLQNGAIDAVPVNGKYKIPKEYVVEFMMTTRYLQGKGQSDRYIDIMNGVAALNEKIQENEERKADQKNLKQYLDNQDAFHNGYVKKALSLTDVLSRKQLSEFFGCPDCVIRTLLKTGAIQSVLVSKQYKIPVIAVKDYVKHKRYMSNEPLLKCMLSAYAQKQRLHRESASPDPDLGSSDELSSKV